MTRPFQALLFGLRRIGLLGWIGAILALAAIAYAAIIVPQQEDELSAASDEIARLQERRLSMEQRPRIADADTQAKSATDLPAMNATPEVLLKLEGLARDDKLQLKRNDYRYVDRVPPASDKKTAHIPVPMQDPVVEVRIAMPSGGRYNNIRAFIAHALENQPTLVLDGMSLKRESIAQGDIQAQLRFTLFARRD